MNWSRRALLKASGVAAIPEFATAPFARAADDLTNLAAAEAVAHIQAGDIKAEAYARALLDRANATRHLNALILLDGDQVMAAARQLDIERARGVPTRALHGLPVLIKDNINTASLRTTAATPALAENRPRLDAEIVMKLRDAGGTVFAKANMHELAFGVTSNNPKFGAVRNPYDPRMIPGGSSGGNAAAVAARLTPAGVGTDTGGSTRIPAALCGIVGFRPTIGRYPGRLNTDVVPISHTRDTPGPMARTVADVILLDAVMAGAPDPWQHLAQLRAQIDIRRLRLGVPRGYFFADLDGELEPVIAEALLKLRSAGVTLVDVDTPGLAELVEAVGNPVSVFEVGTDLPAYLEANGTGLGLKDIAAAAASPDVRHALKLVIDSAVPEAVYREALTKTRPRLIEVLRAALAGVDALVFPTTPLPARPIGQDIDVDLNGRRVGTFDIFSRNAEPGANADMPGLSLPAGMTRSGLPVGLEIDGLRGSDSKLLAIGLALEQLLGRLPAPG